MYGITETTVHATARTLSRADALSGSRSVGWPLPGWNIYVLSPEGNPLTPGVAGEIYVGGAGVSQGYRNRPELTAQRFVVDPWGNGRMYRSGDMGRILRDGSIEYLGRLDNQIKLRGYRIELDEVTHVLERDPAVSRAVVIAANRETSDVARMRLEGYVILKYGTTAELRERLKQQLPSYMIPARLQGVDSIPINENGKVDLDALREALKEAPPAADDGHTPEETVVSIWASVLERPITLDDDFFECGGNSLLAVRLVARLNEIGLSIDIPLLYSNPTPRQLIRSSANDLESDGVHNASR
jgi:acyl-coenzyme A synthetase/AMP-(fatty) acid ligase/aryl carrier-like protein